MCNTKYNIKPSSHIDQQGILNFSEYQIWGDLWDWSVASCVLLLFDTLFSKVRSRPPQLLVICFNLSHTPGLSAMQRSFWCSKLVGIWCFIFMLELYPDCIHVLWNDWWSSVRKTIVPRGWSYRLGPSAIKGFAASLKERSEELEGSLIKHPSLFRQLWALNQGPFPYAQS